MKLKSSLKDGGTITTPNDHIVLPPTCARGHHPDGSKANHALVFNLDHSSGAAQVVVRLTVALNDSLTESLIIKILTAEINKSFLLLLPNLKCH